MSYPTTLLCILPCFILYYALHTSHSFGFMVCVCSLQPHHFSYGIALLHSFVHSLHWQLSRQLYITLCRLLWFGSRQIGGRSVFYVAECGLIVGLMVGSWICVIIPFAYLNRTVVNELMVVL